MENKAINFFSQCDSNLAQGDIFCLNLVAPHADREIRIFRTEEGFHGSLVFGSGLQPRIWDYDELMDALKEIEPSQRLLPFEKTPQGSHEMVVVHAELLQYFILGSQTCDVSGPKPKPFATILPIVTLCSLITREKFPIGLEEKEISDHSKWNTIYEVLCGNLGKNLDSLLNDHFSLPREIRSLLNEWNPTTKKDKEIKNRIRNCLNSATDNQKTYMYYLPPEQGFKMPEAYVDFCRPYILPIQTVENLGQYRIACIKNPYRDEFAQKMGLFLSRIATPAPVKPLAF